jgi:hypothetical protein
MPKSAKPWSSPYTGVTHHYDGGMFDWHGAIHNPACPPYANLTAQSGVDALLRMAANDPKLEDGAFVAVSQALHGERADTIVDTGKGGQTR